MLLDIISLITYPLVYSFQFSIAWNKTIKEEIIGEKIITDVWDN